MKRQFSPLRAGFLALVITLSIATSFVGHARLPVGHWVPSGVDDCGPDHICVKWEVQGILEEDPCCIPEANFLDTDFLACLSHLRH